MNNQNNMNNLYRNAMFGQQQNDQNKPAQFSSPFGNQSNGATSPFGSQNNSATGAFGNQNNSATGSFGSQNNNTSSSFIPQSNSTSSSFIPQSNNTSSSFIPQSNNTSSPFGSQSTLPAHPLQQSMPQGQQYNIGNTFDTMKRPGFGPQPFNLQNSNVQNTMQNNNLQNSGVQNTMQNSNLQKQWSGSLFGSSQPSNAMFSSTGMKNGTKDKCYEPQKIREEKGFGFLEHNHINTMKEYKDKSCDELRVEDYNLGRKPSQQGTQNVTPLWSNSAQQNNNALPAPVSFGTSQSSYGSTPSSFGTNQSSYSTPFQPSGNVYTNTNAPTAFGAQAQPSLTSSSGVQSTQSSNPFMKMFGSQQAAPAAAVPTAQVSSVPSAPATSQFTMGNAFSGLNRPSQPAVSPFATTGTGQPSFSSPFQQAAASAPPAGNPSQSLFTSTPSFTPSQVPYANNNQFQTQQPSFFPSQQSAMPIQNTSVGCTFSQPPCNVDMSDPYGSKNMIFFTKDKEPSPYIQYIAEPIYKEKNDKKVEVLEYREPSKEVREEVYTIPAYEDVKGLKYVTNLIIGFPGKGKIEYLENISTNDMTLDNILDKVLFLKDGVIINDEPGRGLNKRATVHIEKLYPFCKTDGCMIIGRASSYPQRGIQDRFVYDLKMDDKKKFIDYDYDTGLYVYETLHF